jgi:uncharacterized protein (TIGR03435 family)
LQALDTIAAKKALHAFPPESRQSVEEPTPGAMMRKIPILTMASILPLLVTAQPQRGFEAASIKPNKGCPGPYGRNLPGRLVMNCYSIQELAAFAWGVRNEQVVGQFFPDRYDIEATVDSATPINQMYGSMLQTLLEERFALKLHLETRDVPIYNLTVGKNGLKMPPAKSDCVVSPADGGPPLSPSQGRATGPIFFCNHPNTGTHGYNRTIEGKGITMKALAESLSRTELKRTVADKTGLAEAFDVTLHWETDPSSPLYDGIGGAPTSEPSSTGPSLFTAIEEQLGLKLQTSRGPDEVLVIDRVEKPTQ